MTRVSTKLEILIQESIDRHSQGERVQWDLGLFPGQNGAPVHYLYCTMPKALLGEWAIAGAFVNNGHTLNAADVDGMVIQLLEQLRASRSQDLKLHVTPEVGQIVQFP
jgi:hypothetical protein